MGETLRAALNALAVAAPNSLLAQVTADWFDRCADRFEQYRLPQERAVQVDVAETIGRDGLHLLLAPYGEGPPYGLREVPAVEVVRQL